MQRDSLIAPAELEAQRAALSSAATELAALHGELGKLPKAIEASKSTLEDRASSLEESRGAADKAERDVEYRIGELSKGVKAFEALGLRFQTLPEGKLQLVFTRIDALAPSREFTIAVRVDDGNRFQVLSCEPAIADLAPEIDELNTTSDFSRFVQSVRTKFKGLCE
jgi:hypothetical protein